MDPGRSQMSIFNYKSQNTMVILSLILSFILLTTRGHHTIIFHTKPFEQTFRDYCGINLLLRDQYGSHYLYLNLKILQAGRLIEVKIDIKHHLGPLFGWPRPLNRGSRLIEG